jgi:CHAD domain-containing protein
MISNADAKSSKELATQLFNIYKNTVHEIEVLANRAPDQIVESVHLIRKRLKFLRAFVKLTQFCNEQNEYKPVNYILRDCGRTISDCRDAHVRGLLLTEFTATESSDELIQELTELNESITKNIEKNLLFGTSVFDELVAGVSGKEVNKYFKTLSPDSDCLASGYTLSYEKSYHAYHSELKSHEADLLHEWRKRTKDLQYQQEALIDSIPDQLSPSYEEVSGLCEILGRINDIFMFLEWLNSIKQSIQTTKELPLLEQKLRYELRELEDKADELGAALFSTNPEEYKREIKEHVES